MHDPEQRPAPSHPLKIRIHRDSTSRPAPSPGLVQNGNGNGGGLATGVGIGVGGTSAGTGAKEEVASAVDERELEDALPRTLMGQVPLGLAVSRIVQHAYAELGNMAETYVHLNCGFRVPVVFC